MVQKLQLKILLKDIKFIMLTILIPCYNEVKTIEKLINKIINLKIKKQVIIIDDGSTDGTLGVLKRNKKKSIS